MWSLISLFFICGDLTLNEESLLIKQMPFKGITEKMFLVLLLIMVFCWVIKLFFLLIKVVVFLKIKEIGIVNLKRYIYAYSIFSKPLRELKNTHLAKQDMKFEDYQVERDIHEQVRNVEAKYPDDIYTVLRVPAAFFMEYLFIPAFIFLLALFTIILLIYRIVT